MQLIKTKRERERERERETSYAQAQLQETSIQTELQRNLFEVEH